MRYWEDFSVGEVFDLGSRRLSEKEIVEFARQWDPQPFHLDPNADSPFGGLVASGWQTVCVVMRLFVDGVLTDAAALGSPGLDELRWLAPVRPGDLLQGRVTVAEVAQSASRPGRGTVHLLWTVSNDQGTEVCRMRGRMLFSRRPPGAATT